MPRKTMGVVTLIVPAPAELKIAESDFVLFQGMFDDQLLVVVVFHWKLPEVLVQVMSLALAGGENKLATPATINNLRRRIDHVSRRSGTARSGISHNKSKLDCFLDIGTLPICWSSINRSARD